MNIAIVGYGLEGQAAYEYWKDRTSITICDQNEVEVPAGIHTQFGPNYLADLSRFDLIVRTPGVKPEDIISVNGDAILDKVTTNTNEFFASCPSKNLVGVTGTKGKGTTSTLIQKIIEAAGYRSHLGGNIGLPALKILNDGVAKDDWVVLELSSFQLIDCRYSPHIAICLMVFPEHLDWHPEVNEYFNAKTQLFRYQSSDDVAIYYAFNDNSKRIASTGKGWKIPYFDDPGALIKDGWVHIAGENICHTDELALKGKHNWQNVCAAVTAAWQITRDKEAIKKILTTFSGLEHRLEFVAEIDNVKYYDDSFGTTPETAMVAIEAFNEPKVVILGGSNKGASYDELASAVKTGNVRTVLEIGQQVPLLNSS